LVTKAVKQMGIKINWKGFIYDRVWFGWYWSDHQTAELTPGWTRSTTSHWVIIRRWGYHA